MSFSALQRAENSSNAFRDDDLTRGSRFQCSSASRKFLKDIAVTCNVEYVAEVSVLFSEPKIPQMTGRRARVSQQTGFSALQRAENSSKMLCMVWEGVTKSFSALQRAENSSKPMCHTSSCPPTLVSVLFSEPKIPQTALSCNRDLSKSTFQCSSASRKFLKR